MINKIIGTINEKGEYSLLTEEIDNGWILETIDENGEVNNEFIEDSNKEYTEEFHKTNKKKKENE